MIMYIITALIFVIIFVNYFLGSVLYKEPKSEIYYSNVSNYNVIDKKVLMASPSYVAILSILFGSFAGIYLSLCDIQGVNQYIKWATIIVLFLLYLTEITRKISMTDLDLEFEKIFTPTKKIPLSKIDGMFIYSYNKKFLNKRALTTKLVVTTGKEKYKFTLSSFNIKAVMNMMKENFNVSNGKMYVYKRKEM